jgi:hypothetical protein
MHRIAIGGGVMGAVFAIGTVLIFVIGVPFGGWFLLASVVAGACVGTVMHAWHGNHPVEVIDLHHPSASLPRKR